MAKKRHNADHRDATRGEDIRIQGLNSIEDCQAIGDMRADPDSLAEVTRWVTGGSDQSIERVGEEEWTVEAFGCGFVLGKLVGPVRW